MFCTRLLAPKSYLDRNRRLPAVNGPDQPRRQDRPAAKVGNDGTLVLPVPLWDPYVSMACNNVQGNYVNAQETVTFLVPNIAILCYA